MQKTNILEYLEESARRCGDKVALTDGAYSLTFATVKKMARAIGGHLLKRGFYRQAVAVLMDKHPDTVCAFLGVLYSGCFYVCIDPDMPDARILSIVDSVRAEAVICNEKSKERARVLSGRAEIISFEEAFSGDSDLEALKDVRERATDKDLAYVVFTSGSTGEPRGVCASHHSVIDYAEALVAALGFDENTVFGNQAPLYYDAPLKELLPSLSLGAMTCFIPQKLFMFPVKLCEFIRDNGINTLCWAASAFANVSLLGALDVVPLSNIRTICFGSEIFPRSEYEKWRRACPDATFINLYGPTEATGMSTYWIADRELEKGEPIPIGRPFKNTEILLIDDSGKAGDEGEIYIRGRCVTCGYFGHREMSDECFVQDPTNPFFNDVVYKTGDMGKINGRGELVYLGRRDSQIKHMGRRIELCEIERAAESVGARAARCLYDSERKRIMLAYVGDVAEGELIRSLSDMLPRYMLPVVCCRLCALPQLPNGKTDRRALAKILSSKEKK